MFKEINNLNNEKQALNELDARTVRNAGKEVGKAAKTTGKGAWAFMKDIALNTTDILANDGRNTAHFTDDFRREQGDEKDTGDSFNNAETRSLMKRILSLDLKTRIQVRDMLASYKDMLAKEDEAIKAKKAGKDGGGDKGGGKSGKSTPEATPANQQKRLGGSKDQKRLGGKGQQKRLGHGGDKVLNTAPQKMLSPSRAMESFLMMLEGYTTTKITDDEVKKVLANVSKFYFWKHGEEITQKIVNSFKGITLPSNTVTQYWSKKGKPNTKLRLYNFMKGLKLNDKQMYASFKNSGIELSHEDLKRMDLNSKSIFDPKTISEDNVKLLATNLSAGLNLRRFIRELTTSINVEKRKQDGDKNPSSAKKEKGSQMQVANKGKGLQSGGSFGKLPPLSDIK